MSEPEQHESTAAAREERQEQIMRQRAQLVGASMLCFCTAALAGSGGLLFTLWGGEAWSMMPPYAALSAGLLSTFFWWLLNRREVTSHGGFYAGLLSLLLTHPLLWLCVAVHGYITHGELDLFAPLIMTLVGFMILGLPSAILGGITGASIARLVLPARPPQLPPRAPQLSEQIP